MNSVLAYSRGQIALYKYLTFLYLHDTLFDSKALRGGQETMPIKNLSVVDVVGIAVSWAGAAAIAILLRPVDSLVAIVAIAASYCLAKWVILKGENLLSAGDVAGILLAWGAATAVSYFVQDGLVAIICIAAAYYFSKWIIRKEAEGPTS